MVRRSRMRASLLVCAVSVRRCSAVSVRGCSTLARARLTTRPPGAVGTFLRIITVNDVYVLCNYPRLATAIRMARDAACDIDCVVSSHMNGDFLSPSIFTSIDGGRILMQALSLAGVDYASLGNHEFDLGFAGLRRRLQEFDGVVINSNAAVEELQHVTVPYASVDVGGRTGLLLGTVTAARDIYPPSAMPAEIVPAAVAVERAWERATAGDARPPDVLVPMTHQDLAEDVAMAQALTAHPELSRRVPAILGGHDHEESVLTVGSTVVVKAGQDAEKIGLVDVWWDGDGAVRASTELLPAAAFAEEAACAAFVQRSEQFLETLKRTPVTTLPAAGSTKRVRLEPSSVASFLLTTARLPRTLGPRALSLFVTCSRAAAPPSFGPQPSSARAASEPWPFARACRRTD